MHQEAKRKTVHIGMVFFSLLVGRVPPLFISGACAAAIILNLWVLPRVTEHGLERNHEKERGFSLGIVMYPTVLFFLSLVFFDQQIFLVIAWGAIAFGDGFAGLIGRALGGPKIPWNSEKTWAGTLAFFLFGSTLTLAWIYLLPEASRLGISLERWLLVIAVAVLTAAMIETVKGLIDDNFVVPPTAAATAFFLADIEAWPPLPSAWPIGLAAVLLLTVFSIASRKIDVPGGLAGGALAFSIFLGGGLGGVLLLFCFFVLGSTASHWKRKEKGRVGLAQENRGRRSVRHAVSNGGVAAACGLLGWFYPQKLELFSAMLAASLASAAADTLASELGNVYGRRFVNILTFRPDSRGLDGVISLEGSLLGALGAAVIAAIFAAQGYPLMTAVWVATAGTFGNTLDSVLGASLQRLGYMSNDTVNFANTLGGALFILAVLSLSG